MQLDRTELDAIEFQLWPARRPPRLNDAPAAHRGPPMHQKSVAGRSSTPNAPAASAAPIMRKATTRSAHRASIRQRHAAPGSRPLRLAHHLHVRDRPELRQLAHDPLQ